MFTETYEHDKRSILTCTCTGMPNILSYIDIYVYITTIIVTTAIMRQPIAF